MTRFAFDGISLDDLKELRNESTTTSGDDNFSYDLVDKIVTIHYNQQMSVYEELVIDSELILDGRLFLYE